MMNRLALLLAVTACVSQDESPLPSLDDAKDDSFRAPTRHGAISFGELTTAKLAPSARYHAWTFELHADAEVDISTARAARDAEDVDTVLYLYKQRPSGSWGAYVERNDNVASTITWSAIERDTLTAGRYLILVKGFNHDDVGPFGVKVRCVGAGCRAPGEPWIGLSCQDAGCTIPPTWDPIDHLDAAFAVARAELDEHVDMNYAPLYLVGIQFGRETPISAAAASPDDFEWYLTFFRPNEHPGPDGYPGWVALVGAHRHEVDVFEDGYGAPTYELIDRDAARTITRTFRDTLAAHAPNGFSLDRGGLAQLAAAGRPAYFVTNTVTGATKNYPAR